MISSRIPSRRLSTGTDKMKSEPRDQKPESAPEETVKTEEAKEQLLRLRADFENTKKRLEKDKFEAIRFANERLLGEILHVVDNFDRAMTSLSEGHDPEKVKQGLKLAQDELHKVLEVHGVQIIPCVGREFDPKVHEAVAVVESGEVKEGFVIDELQKGYILNGRLLRPSKVRIAGPKTGDRIRDTEDR